MARSILLVHGNADDREMYAEYLRPQQFVVVEAPTTDSALPLVQAVDAVVTGLLVPGSVDGVGLIRRIELGGARTKSRSSSSPRAQ